MSLIHIEGFDDSIASGSAGLPPGWTTTNFTFNTSYSRFGVGMGVTQSGGAYWALPSAKTELIVGISVRIVTASSIGSANDYFFGFGNTNDTTQFVIAPWFGGGVCLRRGNGAGAVVYSTMNGGIQQGGTYYIEAKVKLSDTVGSAVVRVNGVEVINQTNIDTKETTGADDTITNIYIDSGGRYYFDDLYIADTGGSAPYNNFLGDVRVYSLLPNANGDFSQGLGSDANSTDNYLLVDEAVPSSTDYVDLGTGEKDTYGFADTAFASGATVLAVQTTSHLLKTDTGTITAQNVARLGTNESLGSVINPSTSAVPYHTVFESKPGGGSWTKADVDSAQFGVVAT